MNRENLKLLLVATVCLTAGWTGPAVAGAVVTYAQNSDKVDGKHAVGAGASTAARKGKLVATSPTTGRLPNNIIAKAPDAAKLGGNSAATLRTMSLTARSALLTGSSTDGGFGPYIPASPDSGFRIPFVVPPSHKQGGAIAVDVTIYSGSACTFHGQMEVQLHQLSPGSDLFSFATTPYTKIGDWYVLPLATGYNKRTFGIASSAKSGDLVELSFQRDGGLGTCGAIEAQGLQVRY